MINKKELKQIESIRKEITYLGKKIKRIDEKPIKVVQDSVSSSSREFPYTRHTTRIEGFEYPKNRNKYKKLLRGAQYKLEKLINNLEYELNKIEDSEVRMIIRYKYEEDKSWIQIMHLMDYESEEAPRIKLNRFFEKNKKTF